MASKLFTFTFTFTNPMQPAMAAAIAVLTNAQTHHRLTTQLA